MKIMIEITGKQAMNEDLTYRQVMAALEDHLEDCGQCDMRHPIGFTGDCRDDDNRFPLT